MPLSYPPLGMYRQHKQISEGQELVVPACTLLSCSLGVIPGGCYLV